MTNETDAITALKGIARIEAAARTGKGWYGRYLWLFAAWQLVLVPAVLLWRGPAALAVTMPANLLAVTALSVFAVRRPVVPRGLTRRHLTVIGAWAAAYCASLALGLTAFTDSVPFAAAAALACAAPAAVAALRESRPA
ncbi:MULTISPECIES: hypothetical protein [Streptomyces]|uniref:hypothetical protein n=1 Tax=Streptomyces TaxID=1883 RepID=UPI001677D718|nr:MULTISPECIES: hypothetical protein [Streptomyces]MBD3575399.1 hypothetical protein [Streptomyces sp. KD18]GGS92941.1 hypothetical protein GCM10010286_17190 [Streptomyces toxytricini]